MAHMEPNERLRKVREARGYSSAAKAAEAIGVAYGTYSGHENGLRGIPREEIIRYSKFFRVSPAWLDYGEENIDISFPEEALSALKSLKDGYITKAAELILMIKTLQDAGQSLPVTQELHTAERLPPTLAAQASLQKGKR